MPRHGIAHDAQSNEGDGSAFGHGILTVRCEVTHLTTPPPALHRRTIATAGRVSPNGPGGKLDAMPRRQLPSVDRVLNDPATRTVVDRWGHGTVKSAVRALQTELRADTEIPAWAVSVESYAPAVTTRLERHLGRGHAPVFNLTGTLVHTNLGRSPLHPGLVEAALRSATRPVALEYDLVTGKRGDREAIIAHRLRLLTGAEGATAVNNNAAAVLLVLNTLAHDKNVPVSRGELIEIGGSFRLPEVMERAGCRLREIGTTNRTHPRDYENAIDDGTALLLKVHPSNYRVEGFASGVAIADAADIAHRHGLPLCVDAGSGALVDLSKYGLPHEPLPGELLAAGADLVTFSGDKLLGGAQAGIIVGKQPLIEKINANPLKRALRLDKLALALLDETLKAYEDEATVPWTIPVIGMIALPIAELERRAGVVADALAGVEGATIAVESSQAETGSGALPGQVLESRAVTVAFARNRDLTAFEASLRGLDPAVVGRIANDRLWLDMRGADPLDELARVLGSLG